jgi:hypothetical protein
MTNSAVPLWKAKQTAETNRVEEVFRKAGFQQVDSYRYNSASIRVRVIDRQFEGISVEERDKLVEPHLSQLDERTQGDIMNLFVFAPSEIQHSLLNAEFEEPSPSML